MTWPDVHSEERHLVRNFLRMQAEHAEGESRKYRHAHYANVMQCDVWDRQAAAFRAALAVLDAVPRG